MAYQPILNPQPVSGGSTNAGGASASTTFTAADLVVAAPDGTGTLLSGTPTSGSTTAPFAVADGLIASLFLIKGLTTSQTTITIYFEGSANSTNGVDGDWIELKQRRTGTQVGVESADYKTQANGYFRGNCAGFKWLRARLLGTFTGTPSAQMWTSAGQSATFLNSGLPGGSSTIGGVTLTDGTNQANVIAGDTGFNGQAVANNRKTIPFTTSTAGAQTLLANTDTRGFSWISVITTSIGVGLAWNGQFSSISGGTYISTQGWQDRSSTGSVPGSLATSNLKIYGSAVDSDYFQLTLTALTSGTVSGYVVLSAFPLLYTALNVSSGSTLVSNVSQYNGSTVALGNGTQASGTLRVTVASDSTGQTSIASKASGGATTYSLVSAATTNSVNIKSLTATVYGVQASNTGAAVAFLKLYAKVSAPTVGTDTPTKTLMIPAGGSIFLPATVVGINFTAGLGIAITGVATAADTTAVAANQVVVNIDYA